MKQDNEIKYRFNLKIKYMATKSILIKTVHVLYNFYLFNYVSNYRRLDIFKAIQDVIVNTEPALTISRTKHHPSNSYF